MNVTVFGAAAPQPTDPDYEDARRLGRLLAEHGHTVLTGGYIGTMEAASRGANEAGGHVVGVTCEEIEAWRKRRPNEWVIEERRHHTLTERLLGLIDGCDVAVALPGGIGTLTEIAMVWNRMAIQSIQPRPLILVGPGWKRIFTAFATEMAGYVPAADLDLLVYVDRVEDVIAVLEPLA